MVRTHTLDPTPDAPILKFILPIQLLIKDIGISDCLDCFWRKSEKQSKTGLTEILLSQTKEGETQNGQKIMKIWYFATKSDN